MTACKTLALFKINQMRRKSTTKALKLKTYRSMHAKTCTYFFLSSPPPPPPVIIEEEKSSSFVAFAFELIASGEGARCKLSSCAAHEISRRRFKWSVKSNTNVKVKCLIICAVNERVNENVIKISFIGIKLFMSLLS